MTPTTLIIVRHGQVENPYGTHYGNMPGYPLDSNGKKNVGKLGDQLKQANNLPDIIFHSPTLRTTQTAQILSHKLSPHWLGHPGIQTTADMRLADIHNKALEGQPHRDYLSEDEMDTGYEWETLGSVINRTTDFFASLIAEYEGRTVCVVSHEHNIAIAIAWMNGENFTEIAHMKEIDIIHTESFQRLRNYLLKPGEAFIASITEQGMMEGGPKRISPYSESRGRGERY